ncbi:MAG: transcription termination factor Rho [Planctomycetes bacterium]|nr:transcription termination factor Rho [Planctomycetota bacterium]
MTEPNQQSGGQPHDVPFGAMIFGEGASSKGREAGPQGAAGDRPDWRRSDNRRGHGRRGGRRRRRQGSDGGPEGGPEGSSPDTANAPEPNGGEPRAEGGGSDPRGAVREDPRGRPRNDRPHDSHSNAPRAPADNAAANRVDSGERNGGERAPGGGERTDWNGGPPRGGNQYSDERQGRRRRRRRGRGGRGDWNNGGERQAAPNVSVADGGAEPRTLEERPRDDRPREDRPREDRPRDDRPRDDRGQGAPQRRAPAEPLAPASGVLTLEKGNFGFLRKLENDLLRSNDDVFVAQNLVLRHKLREGSMIEGPVARGGGQSKYQLLDVRTVDGQPPRDVANLVAFKRLTSIDPDFHYAVGDPTGDVNLKILDLLCPIGRGTRGLLVAPPRSGKTILMRKFAKAIEEHYPEVELMVLLVDERPEEATEWKRSVERGHVFVSTNDEMAERHCQLAEAVQARAIRLVELGKDVVLLLDSITRLARAYNSAQSGSGRTMSGGLDTRTMEKPKAFFGSARNTESAGSLTILGTTLVDTGSRMDQVIFEEFKGTGNMELVLSRRLADRRIFPAIDVEKSGTRKEEKLISARRLKQIHILRRVLAKMNPVEAMELLITKLEDAEKTDDFLKRFEVDPEA